MTVNLMAAGFQFGTPGLTVIPPTVWQPDPAFRDSVPAAPRRKLGVVLHYPGIVAPNNASYIHNCAEAARVIQRAYRADPKRKYDIGYNFLTDQAGRVATARGLYRSAANGTTTSNDSYNAMLILVDPDEGITEFQILSVQRYIYALRNDYGYGPAIIGHRQVKPTSCPGDQIYSLIQAGAFEPNPASWPENRFNPWQRKYGPLPQATKPELHGGEGPSNYVVSYLQGVAINEASQVITDLDGTYSWSTVSAVINLKTWYNATKPAGAPESDMSEPGLVDQPLWNYIDWIASDPV